MALRFPLHVERIEGSPGAPVLVFLHHGLGSVAQWRDFPMRLVEKTGCPALIYDRVGHGKSPALGGPRPARYLFDEAAVLKDLLVEENITDFVLIGHSDGGSIALIYPSLNGIQPRAIICEAAHVFVEECTRAGIRDVVSDWRNTLRGPLQRYHGDKTDALFLNWAEVWLSAAFDSFDISGELAAIRCPVLAIQGEQDEFGSSAQLEALAKGAGAETLLAPNCGHEPHSQAVEVTLEAMRAWIQAALHQSSGGELNPVAAC